MLDTELVTLDSDAVRCNISGFLPLHAVTANRLTDMYNWLTDRRCDAAPLEPGRDPLICRAAGPMLEPGTLQICLLTPRLPRTLSDVARDGEPHLKQHQLADPHTAVHNAKLPQLRSGRTAPASNHA
eukprot:scaffold38128_cov45-Phaeocystis_antarctica.AAC.2